MQVIGNFVTSNMASATIMVASSNEKNADFESPTPISNMGSTCTSLLLVKVLDLYTVFEFKGNFYVKGKMYGIFLAIPINS